MKDCRPTNGNSASAPGRHEGIMPARYTAVSLNRDERYAFPKCPVSMPGLRSAPDGSGH
jgi:hypothetical protein